MTTLLQDSPPDLSHVENWVFDLDNTLYPRHSNLFAQIDSRMTRYVEKLLQLPSEEARSLQKALYRDYGTTLHGLMERHRIDADDFLEFVHDIDYSGLQPDPALGQAIRALPGRRFIFTNGDTAHAERTARQLGIYDHFHEIFDIVAAGLVPKPNRGTYDKFVALHGIETSRSVMFEDLARNLVVPKQLGMATVLIVPKNMEAVIGDAWEHDGEDHDHVDYVTDDLRDFLTGLVLADPQVEPRSGSGSE